MTFCASDSGGCSTTEQRVSLRLCCSVLCTSPQAACALRQSLVICLSNRGGNRDFLCQAHGAAPAAESQAAPAQLLCQRGSALRQQLGVPWASPPLQHPCSWDGGAQREDIESQCPDWFLVGFFPAQLINSLLIRNVWQLLWKTLTCWKW